MLYSQPVLLNWPNSSINSTFKYCVAACCNFFLNNKRIQLETMPHCTVLLKVIAVCMLGTPPTPVVCNISRCDVEFLAVAQESILPAFDGNVFPPTQPLAHWVHIKIQT